MPCPAGPENNNTLHNDSSTTNYEMPATQNTSPLKACVAEWHAELAAVHAHRCTAATCPGMRSAQHICQQPEYVAERGGSACDEAIEAEMLIHIVYHGARILPPGKQPEQVPGFEVHNYPASTEEQAAIQANIEQELRDGLLVEVARKPAHITALATKQEEDKIRILRDCSKPDGAAINDHADAMHFSMMGLEDAQAEMKPHAYMAKVDIKSAFRTVGVHPEHWHLLGFKYTPRGGASERYFVDTRCPFGLKCSPEIFCRLSTAVRAMLTRRGIKAVVVYVDDFLILADTEAECARALAVLLELLPRLGFTVSEKKTVQPTQRIIFLGLQLATNEDGAGKMTVTVPEPKLRRAEETALQLHGRSEISLKQLEQAVGFFNHIAQAVYSARCFYRRLIYAIRDAKAAGRTKIKVTTDIRLDLNFWIHFARHYNGQAVILTAPQQQHGFLATDASDWGMGGFFDNGEGDIRTFSVPWAQLQSTGTDLQMQHYNERELWPTRGDAKLWRIEYREQFAMWWAVLQWGPLFRNKMLLWHQDNTVAEANVNRMGAKAPHFMRLLRHFYKVAALENVRHTATRITSEANTLADLLSRGQPAAFAAALQCHLLTPQRGAQAWQPRQPSDPGLMVHRPQQLAEQQRLQLGATPGGGAPAAGDEDRPQGPAAKRARAGAP